MISTLSDSREFGIPCYEGIVVKGSFQGEV